MDKLYLGVIAILIFIIITESIYLTIKVNMDNKIITELSAENKALQAKISSAESYIDMQNVKILEYGSNMEKAEEAYKENIKNINEKYRALKKQYENMEHKSCEEMLNIIDNNQRRFLND